MIWEECAADRERANTKKQVYPASKAMEKLQLYSPAQVWYTKAVFQGEVS